MLEFGVRFSEDLYIKVSFNPDDRKGAVTAIFGRGEREVVKSDSFSLSDGVH